MPPMWLLLALVFGGVFVVTALLLAATQAGASRALRETLARLDEVSATSREAALDDVAILKREELLSSIAWIDRFLRRLDLFGRLRLLLQQAGSSWTVGGVILASLACWAVLAAGLYLRTRLLAAALLMGAAAITFPWLYLLRARARRFASFEQMLPEALDLMVSALRAGHGLSTAIGAVGKELSGVVAKEFRQCFEEMNFGLELRVALLNLAARMPIQDVRIVVTAILVQKESGGNLAEVLDKVASVIRERFRLKREIQTRTAQGRLTGWILASLPLVFGVLLYLVSPEHISVLWTRPLGLKMLYGAAIMTVIGALIIRKIVRVRV